MAMRDHDERELIAGGICAGKRTAAPDAPDSLPDLDAIARSSLDVLRQHRGAWAPEIELRPGAERF
jgi:hypothetical protein